MTQKMDPGLYTVWSLKHVHKDAFASISKRTVYYYTAIDFGHIPQFLYSEIQIDHLLFVNFHSI